MPLKEGYPESSMPKLKRRKKQKVKVAKMKYKADPMIKEGGGVKMKPYVKPGKITYLKGGKEVSRAKLVVKQTEQRLSDQDRKFYGTSRLEKARMKTEEAGKEMLERGRYRSEKYLRKVIKGMK